MELTPGVAFYCHVLVERLAVCCVFHAPLYPFFALSSPSHLYAMFVISSFPCPIPTTDSLATF